MKCQNCHNEYFPLVSDTFYDSGVKYHMYVCPVCGNENFYAVEKHHHFNKTKVKERISELACMIVIFCSTYYVLSHLNIFCTTFR